MAIREIDDGHLGLALDIIELRSFASCWGEFQRSATKMDLDESPMMDTVKSIAFELAHDAMRARA